jgi:sigma-B regulation protein RsbU (phosphoserine phosphatase)
MLHTPLAVPTLSFNYRLEISRYPSSGEITMGDPINETDRAIDEDAAIRMILEGTANTTSEGFFMLDDQMRIIDVNDAYCRLLGYSREDIIGRRPYDFATPEFQQFYHTHRGDPFSPSASETKATLVAKDGHHIPVLFHGNTVQSGGGRTLGKMAFVTDMREHTKSMALAGEVQKSLLPGRFPDIEGLDIAGRSIPCDEIGGDYYDFIEIPGRRDAIHLVVGDMSGHGVDAALLMTTARAFLRMRACQPGKIADIVSDLNRHLTTDTRRTDSFMTLFFLSLQVRDQRIQWVRAGHDPAILYDPVTERIETLWGSGLALGLDKSVVYASMEKEGIAPGQVIAIGTDGIWEARNAQGEMYGKQRLNDILTHNAHLAAETIVQAALDDLQQFTQGTMPEDDKTLVVVKIQKG